MTDRERAAKLHERATASVSAIKTGENNLVEIFHEMDLFKGYRFYGAKNLYEYAMKVHKLTESTALNIINVARKSKEVPELRHAVMSGELSISKARKIVPVITPSNKDAWLELAKTSTKQVIEKAVATERPDLAVVESAKYTAGNRVTVTLNLTEEAFENLKRVMDLEAQRTRGGVGKGEAAAAAFDAYLDENDPIREAARAKARNEKKLEKVRAEKKIAEVCKSANVLESTIAIVSIQSMTEGRDAAAPVPGQMKTRYRKALPSVLRHAIDMRDCRQCTFVDGEGVRCEERRWLDYHHVIRVEDGGLDTLENLVTLCSGHHRMEHDGRRSLVQARRQDYHTALLH